MPKKYRNVRNVIILGLVAQKGMLLNLMPNINAMLKTTT